LTELFLAHYQGDAEEFATAENDDLAIFDQFQELGQLAEYQEVYPADNIPSDNEDEDTQETIPSVPSIPPAPISSATNPSGFYSSNPVHHIQMNNQLNDFELGLGLWCEKYGVTRPQYQGLRQLLKILGPHPLVDHLPTSSDVNGPDRFWRTG
jgi:hypothetical protein